MRQVILTSFALVVVLVVHRAGAEQPATALAKLPSYEVLSERLKLEGVERDEVITFTVPRDDLLVSQRDIGEIPVAAGMASTFHFFRCPCGKLNVVGDFLVADYEANDVLDELRQVPDLQIASIAPVLTQERPRVLSVRFAGQASADEVARAVRAALDRTGEARNQRNPHP
ncbi:MAG TPA: DUF1259 domain-containing protein [Tepidisphaeraceae bacterium]|nr:DUF1259 domain-containing protein [Tepidisphaeraceae bacterium]